MCAHIVCVSFFGAARVCQRYFRRKEAKMEVWSTFGAFLQVIKRVNFHCLGTFLAEV